jgi:hypothetical protein
MNVVGNRPSRYWEKKAEDARAQALHRGKEAIQVADLGDLHGKSFFGQAS